MPYKHNQEKQRKFKKTQSSRSDWSSYNNSLKMRGDFTLWLSDDAISAWYEKDRIYDGNGTPNLYSDMAIIAVHEIRQIFKLPPLRAMESEAKASRPR